MGSDKIEFALLSIYDKGLDPRNMSDDELARIRNIGPAGVKEIRERCATGHESIAIFDDRIRRNEQDIQARKEWIQYLDQYALRAEFV